MQAAFEQQKHEMERQMAGQTQAIQQETEKRLNERLAERDAEHARELDAWRAKLEKDKANNVSEYAFIYLNTTNHIGFQAKAELELAAGYEKLRLDEASGMNVHQRHR
jgi:plasmid maintenance system killer protein